MRRQTRGQQAGVQPGALEKKCQDRLETIRQSLLVVAYAWGEVDNTVVTEVDSTIRALEALEATIKECADHLREKPE